MQGVQSAFCEILVDEWPRDGGEEATVRLGSRFIPLAPAIEQQESVRVQTPGDELKVLRDRIDALTTSLSIF